MVTGALQYADVSVTNDGSKDRTEEILREIQNECKQNKHSHALHIITHEKSTHIPRGIQDGMRFAVDHSAYSYVITMDAGMSHDPDALPDFLAVEDQVDVVIGQRKNVKNVPLYRKLVSFLAARVMNYSLSRSYFNLTGPGLKDTTSGFRRYSRKAFEKIARTELRSKAFDFHMEALAICIRSGLIAREIGITYVFSNSSFNRKVLILAMKFALHLITTKGRSIH